MRHLSADRLAELADAVPTAEELAHLAGCRECAAEREAHAQLLTMAAGSDAAGPAPLTDWGTLSARLAAEGLLRTPAGAEVDIDAGDGASARPAADVARVLAFPAGTGGVAPRHVAARRRTMAWLGRAAAAVLLMAGAFAGGRLSVAVPALPDEPPFAVAPLDAGAPPTPGEALVAGVARIAADTLMAFASPEDAMRAMRDAERTYNRAMLYLAGYDSTVSTGDDPARTYRARLAALDELVATTREALYEAPHDPVINRYYMATVGAREATIRQLDDALPMDARLTRF